HHRRALLLGRGRTRAGQGDEHRRSARSQGSKLAHWPSVRDRVAPLLCDVPRLTCRAPAPNGRHSPAEGATPDRASERAASVTPLPSRRTHEPRQPLTPCQHPPTSPRPTGAAPAPQAPTPDRAPVLAASVAPLPGATLANSTHVSPPPPPAPRAALPPPGPPPPAAPAARPPLC